MAYEISFKPAAKRQLKKITKGDARKIITAIEKLATDPRPHGFTPLSENPRLCRIRIGEFRVIYHIGDKELVVLIIIIGHRKDIYERLRNQIKGRDRRFDKG